MTDLPPEEYEKLAKLDAELDTSWCDKYEGNAHLTDSKSLKLKPGKANRPTKAEIQKENEMWEEMEKERLETMPRPPQEGANDSDAWMNRPSTSSGNGPREYIEDVITRLAPYMNELTNTTTTHLN